MKDHQFSFAPSGYLVGPRKLSQTYVMSWEALRKPETDRQRNSDWTPETDYYRR